MIYLSTIHRNAKMRQLERKRAYKAIIINGENIFLLRDHVAKASTSRVLEGNARSLRTQNAVDVVSVVELVVKAVRDLDGLWWVTILYDDQMIRLKKWPPHLQEIQVSNRRYHDIQLVFQQWRWLCWRSCHLQKFETKWERDFRSRPTDGFSNFTYWLWLIYRGGRLFSEG